MNTCMINTEQLFVSLNIINATSLFILLYMIFMMRESKWQWVWYIIFGILLVVATFGSKVYSGCPPSSVVWRLEFIPGQVGTDWGTYVLLGKLVWQFIFDLMAYERNQ